MEGSHATPRAWFQDLTINFGDQLGMIAETRIDHPDKRPISGTEAITHGDCLDTSDCPPEPVAQVRVLLGARTFLVA